MKPFTSPRSENRLENPMSMPEYLLLILAFFCFASAIYSLFQGSRFLTLLFFVLHACSGILFFLISLNRQSLEVTPEPELSYDRNLQKQLLTEKAEEADRLRRQNAQIRKRADQLELELETLKKEQQTILEQQEKTAALICNAEPPLSGLLPARKEEQRIQLDLITAIRRIMEEMQPFTQKAGIQMQLSSSNESLILLADPEYLRILLRNVIDNAVKYMQKSGRLIITVSSIGEDIFMVLKDNGNGLNSEETEHIFELNYQGSNRVSGNGLGLTQAKAIVDHYGGSIYARSGSGNGMAVYIQLPSA